MLALAGLAVVVTACLPVRHDPPPPAPPVPTLAPPPPDVALPANAPLLNVDTSYVTGLDRPWDIAFLPSGTMLYTENDRATVSAYVDAGEPRRVLGTIAGVDNSGEGGVMGLAVDPDYPNSPYLYVCVSNLSPSDNRVLKLTVDPALPAGNALVAATPIITGMSHQGFHDGCRLRFQPGSNPPALFVTMGDAALGTGPQSLDSMNGKVLRVTTDGNGYPGNPFGGNAVRDRIFTSGHRNPQGIAFRPGSNAPYSVEHGPDRNDEVNRLVAGGNGGWDPVPGYDQTLPMTDLAKFPNAMRPVWRSGDGGTIAPSGATFLSGPQWKALDGALAVAVLKGSQLRLMYLDGAGDITGTTAVLQNGVRLRSAVEGPDGALYVSTDQRNGSTAANGQDQIWRISPS
ncbi:MAG TPA: PQQ-dependent sugar dehydrogenase [Acidimicrobiia bacterium]|nr:PQQ-dependent sugar dehydrogenase [Acidimicrobiia bacterium]